MTREEAIENLEEMIKWGDPYEVNYDACKIAIEALKQEPKTGHWRDHQEGRWIYVKCSECGTVHDTRTNFCPNCGARMESEEQA